MNKTDAQEYAAELLDAAADGQWAGLLGTGLNAETVEAVRELNQLNLQITRWEERERQMHHSLVGRLQLLEFDDDPATDGGDGRRTPNIFATKSSQPSEDLEQRTQPTGFDLMDLAMPQRLNMA